MNTQSQETKKPEHPIIILRRDINNGVSEFAKVLPPSIRPEEFARVAITAVQNNPDLLKADRRSLLTALMKAAEDHLLPDGRQGALVVFNTKQMIEGKEVWVPLVQWMPMVEGVRKRIWETAGLLLHTKVVYDRDEYRYREGTTTDPIQHVPQPGPRGIDNIVAVYSIARNNEGRIIDWDWMWKEEVEQIRAKARSDKIWKDPISYPEMAIKTVVHHHSKTLPLSGDVRRIVERDNAMYGEAVDVAPAIAAAVDSKDAAALTYQPGTPFDAGTLDNRAAPAQTQQAPAQRSVEGAMNAMAGGGKPATTTRRNTRAKPETVAPAPSRALHEPIAHAADGTPYNPATGEVIESTAAATAGETSTAETRGENNEAAEAAASGATAPQSSTPAANGGGSSTAAPDFPSFLDRRKTVPECLKELMESAQPSNKEEYLAWFETKWEYANTDAHQEALRQYWQNTGGTRTQFGFTQSDVDALAAKMRRKQPS